MEETLNSAFLLMLIGMLTVFLILAIVVLAGKYLIILVNRFSDTEETIKPLESSLIIPAQHIAVLSAVTDHVTQGKGIVEKIEKL